MNPDDAFERILMSLYRAGLDGAHWPAATALIEEAVGTGRNALVVSEGSDDERRIDFTRWLHRGESCEDFARTYFNVYYPHDEAVPRIERLSHGRLVRVRDLYSEDERKTSPVYNEGLPHLGNQNGLYTRFDGPHGQSVVDPARFRRIDAARVGTMLGLTPSEARMSALLAEGLKVREIAAATGWRENYMTHRGSHEDHCRVAGKPNRPLPGGDPGG